MRATELPSEAPRLPEGTGRARGLPRGRSGRHRHQPCLVARLPARRNGVPWSRRCAALTTLTRAFASTVGDTQRQRERALSDRTEGPSAHLDEERHAGSPTTIAW